MKQPACELCETEGGSLILSNECLRVVLVDDPGFPGFARVIWNDHVREMSDLADEEQQHLMRTVIAVERAQRAVLAPDKINLASLGNLMPHLHWHVIPRFADDGHFPRPVWSECLRQPGEELLEARRAQLGRLRCRMAEEVSRVRRP